jgi:O-methyltransferase/methyltransferase family protein
MMTDATPDSTSNPAAQMRKLVNAYQLSQALHVTAVLGIADLVANGTRDLAGLARATDTHAPTLRRLLRAVSAAGVLHEADDGTYTLTDLGECLRSDAPEPVGGWAAFVGEPYYWNAWTGLLHSVRTGENAFRYVHGVGPWEYRASRPEESARFDAAMATVSRQVTGAIVSAFDFGGFARIVDVGGGNGALLAGILGRNPKSRGVLFDQPHVVSGAAAILEGAGVADRVEVVGGDFFERVPDGGDCYTLKAIVHDWDDERAVAILRSCRRAMHSDATLVLLERELGGPNEHLDAKLSDLNMLVAPGGRERTRAEYAELLADAGFEFVNCTLTNSGFDVYVARPV